MLFLCFPFVFPNVKLLFMEYTPTFEIMAKMKLVGPGDRWKVTEIKLGHAQNLHTVLRCLK
jgi:hypothetical protein